MWSKRPGVSVFAALYSTGKLFNKMIKNVFNKMGKNEAIMYPTQVYKPLVKFWIGIQESNVDIIH